MLLSLSIVVSLFGIVNTLVLTVFERTRELGMLRAVGMSRRQVRRMIRHESIVTALLGAAFGIPLGLVLALLVGAAIKFSAFTIPVGHARRVRDRGGRGRDPGRDLPGAAGGAAQRARRTAVRVGQFAGGELLREFRSGDLASLRPGGAKLLAHDPARGSRQAAGGDIPGGADRVCQPEPVLNISSRLPTR